MTTHWKTEKEKPLKHDVNYMCDLLLISAWSLHNKHAYHKTTCQINFQLYFNATTVFPSNLHPCTFIHYWLQTSDGDSFYNNHQDTMLSHQKTGQQFGISLHSLSIFQQQKFLQSFPGPNYSFSSYYNYFLQTTFITS